MRVLSVLLSGLLAAPLAAGCSFLGLDNLPIEECSVDADCLGLEVPSPPEDDCHTWQCNRVTRRCEIDVLDRDEDGAPARMSTSMRACVASGERVDCSDDPAIDPHAAAMTPGIAEICDGLDSDCDGQIDQGVPGVATMDRAFTTISGNAVSAVVASGGGLDGTELAGLFLISGTPRQLVVVDREGAERALTLMVGPAATVPVRLAALAPVGQRWGVLYFPGGACDRLVLASLRTTPTLDLTVDATLHTDGLPTLPAGACDVTQGALAPNRAADRHLLVAYAAAAETCGVASSHPVHVIDATLPATGAPTFAAAPLTLGETSDWLAPAAVSIAAGIYAVAYPTSAGTIEVQRVDAAAGTASLLYTEPSGALAPSGVRLGFDGDRGLVLTFSVDCGHAPSALRLLTLSTDGTSVTAGATVVLERENDTTSATYQPALDEWLLLSTGVLGWSGQRFDASGVTIGPAFDVRTLTTSTLPSVRALDASAAYEIFGANARTTTSPPAASTLDTLGCLPSP